MPLATKPKQWKASDVVVCWNSFSDTQIPFTAKTGQRLKGSHPAVKAHPECFVRESELLDGNALPDPSMVTPDVDPPKIGRVKLRVKTGLGSRADDLIGGGSKQLITHRGKTYRTGETFTAEGADAAYLIDTGTVEIVQTLKGLVA